MKPYIAKKRQKKPCDLCGQPVLPGDAVAPWCWVDEDRNGSGGIARPHASCAAIWEREGLEEEWFNSGSAFEEVDDDRNPMAGDPPGTKPLLLDEAREALAAARVAANPLLASCLWAHNVIMDALNRNARPEVHLDRLRESYEALEAAGITSQQSMFRAPAEAEVWQAPTAGVAVAAIMGYPFPVRMGARQGESPRCIYGAGDGGSLGITFPTPDECEAAVLEHNRSLPPVTERDDDFEKAAPILGWKCWRYQSDKGTRGLHFVTPDGEDIDYPRADAKPREMLGFVGRIAEAVKLGCRVEIITWPAEQINEVQFSERYGIGQAPDVAWAAVRAVLAMDPKSAR